MGGGVVGKYAGFPPHPPLPTRELSPIYSLSSKKNEKTGRGDTGSRTLQMVRRIKLQLYTVYRVRLSVWISAQIKAVRRILIDAGLRRTSS
jgi:hypothetical protein